MIDRTKKLALKVVGILAVTALTVRQYLQQSSAEQTAVSPANFLFGSALIGCIAALNLSFNTAQRERAQAADVAPPPQLATIQVRPNPVEGEWVNRVQGPAPGGYLEGAQKSGYERL